MIRAALVCAMSSQLIAPFAIAQVVKPAGVPVSAPTEPVVPVIPAPVPISDTETKSNTPNIATVQKFIREDVIRLSSENAIASSSARSDMIAASASKPDQPASAPYLGLYLQTLSTELQPVLAKKPSVRIKVNVGILTARVCENCKEILPPGIPMQSVIVSLLKDENDAVALWGMKAASAALAATNQSVPIDGLLKEIIPTVKAHKLNGAITDEAYNALQDQNPIVIRKLMELYDLRAAAYKDGVPSDPSADKGALSLTVQEGAWGKLTPAEQAKVMNRIADVLSASSHALLKDEANGPQIRVLVKYTCQSVYVVTAKNQPELSAQALAAANKLSDNTPPAVVVQRIDPIVDGVRKAFPQNAAMGDAKSIPGKP